MAKPPLPLIVKWRDLAQEGRFYTDIAKDYPDYTASQIRHYCLGHSGAKAPGPIQKRRRWSDNPWLQGEKSPHALLDEKQVRDVLAMTYSSLLNDLLTWANPGKSIVQE